MRILQIDDETNWHKAAARWLPAEDFDLESYSSIDDGLHALRGGDYDVALLGGVEGLKRLRKIDALVGVVVATENCHTITDAIAAGADDCVSKGGVEDGSTSLVDILAAAALCRDRRARMEVATEMAAGKYRKLRRADTVILSLIFAGTGINA